MRKRLRNGGGVGAGYYSQRSNIFTWALNTVHDFPNSRAASASQGYTVANLQPDNDDATATTMELESRIAWYGWSKACLSPKRWRIFVAQAIPQTLAAGMEEWQVWV